MNATKDLLIVGASTRAAAFSALRAGLTPRCVDFFADRDLMEVCSVERAEARDGAAALERCALESPASPWLYTGPLENHPDRVERISKSHRLCGNSAGTLRATRNPFRLGDLLRERGFPHLDTRRDARGLPRDGSWLVKPIASAGGRLIQHLDRLTLPLAEPCYFQQFLDGPNDSALFLAQNGSAELVGVTRQLLGTQGFPFAYRGNIGPGLVPAALMSRLSQLGNILSSAFSLVGLFGVDYIEHDNQPWLVEVNPRYTAAVEIFELETHRTLLREHLLACGMNLTEPLSTWKQGSESTNASVVAKSVLYADRNMIVPEYTIDDPRSPDLFAVPAIADVPRPGTAIAAGEPIMTVFSTASDFQECADRLSEVEAYWKNRLKG